MKILSNFVNMLRPKSDPSVLYLSIDELHNSRDWSTVDFIACNKLIFSEDIDLGHPTSAPLKP